MFPEREKTFLFDIEGSKDAYEYLLKRYADYSSFFPFDFSFVYNTSSYRGLAVRFGLHRFVSDDKLVAALRLLRWSHEILLYQGTDNYTGRERAPDIISFCRENRCSVNCRLHAVVLFEALMSVGIVSRIICCMPIDVMPFDSHTLVVSHIGNKWVALDPSRNCWFSDSRGEPLSVEEIRNALIYDLPLSFRYVHRFEKLKKPGSLIQNSDEWFKAYLYKNMFRFYYDAVIRINGKIKNMIFHLVPSGYAKTGISSDNRITVTDCSEKFWETPEEKENEI